MSLLSIGPSVFLTVDNLQLSKANIDIGLQLIAHLELPIGLFEEEYYVPREQINSEAPRRFIECRYQDKAAVNAWLASCRNREVPQVLVHPRVRYAEVRWDALTLPDENAKNLRDDAISVIDAIQGVLRYHEERGGVKIGGTIGSTVGWLDKVPIDVARMVAGEIFDVLNAAAKRAL